MKEQMSFGPKKNESVEKYEKTVENFVKPSLKEKISLFFQTAEFSAFKNKGITKEDIIRIDAELELAATKLAEGKELNSPEKQYLDKIKNSDLFFTQNFSPDRSGSYAWTNDSIKGDIKGEEVEVTEQYLMRANTQHPDGREKYEEGKETYSGLLNKKKLSEEDAKKIFDEYNQIAKDRINAINNFISEKNKDKQQEEYKETEEVVKKVIPEDQK